METMTATAAASTNPAKSAARAGKRLTFGGGPECGKALAGLPVELGCPGASGRRAGLPRRARRATPRAVTKDAGAVRT
jgi:hypothetical protein